MMVKPKMSQNKVLYFFAIVIPLLTIICIYNLN